MRHPIPTCDEACDAFRPHFGLLIRAIEEGMERFTRLMHFAARKGDIPNDRTKANLLNSLIVGRANVLSAGHPAIRPEHEIKRYDVFRCSEDYLFCFKKGRAGLAVNHRSRQQEDLRWGHMPLGFPEARWVVVLYEVDAAFVGVQDIRLVRPKGHSSNYWSISVYDEMRGVSAFPLTGSPAPKPTAIEAKTKIRKRKTEGA